MIINDIYRKLFGREGTSKGSDIDMAEHGRNGGISTGVAFKAVQEIPLKTIIDNQGSYIYIGEANPTVATSEAKWRIFKLDISGSITSIYFAGQSDNFDKEWDERGNYLYT
jgi:hypothetical protein